MLKRIVPANDLDYFALETHPKRLYVSSSVDGIEGAVHVYARRTKAENDIVNIDQVFGSSSFNDNNLETIRLLAVNVTSSTDIDSKVRAYMSAVEDNPFSVRKQQEQHILRFQPPFSFNSNFLRKSLVREHLMPFYRVESPKASYGFTNYHCFNFFTSSITPSSSAMLFPNPVLDDGAGSNYMVSSAFSFEMFIKPKYHQDIIQGDYKPGSVLHLDDSYALSVHSGSNEFDIYGHTNKFKAVLQLGSADVADGLEGWDNSSTMTLFTNDVLERDSWNHVVFTWGGPTHNMGSGSIYVNGSLDKHFVITTPLFLGHYTGSRDPSVLVVGNYYSGSNVAPNAMDRFFSHDPATRDGLLELNGTTGLNAPTGSSFTHPLRAEIHDLRLWKRYLPSEEVLRLRANGPDKDLFADLRFAVGPFFTAESPFRTFNGGYGGGELVTPFFAKDATTTTPFAAQMAFSCGGHYINLENYVRDFATGNYPRLWDLTGSVHTPPPSTILSANDFLYATGSIIKRNYTVLPCDDGLYQPNFNTFLDGLDQSRFVNDLGNQDIGTVSLTNLVSDSAGLASNAMSSLPDDGNTEGMLNDVLGARPEATEVIPGNSMAIYHRTKDASSNQVVLFDVCSLFYGLRIKPKSLRITDSSLHMAGFGMTLRDDGVGSLYRADSGDDSAKWTSVGNVFYNEGIILIKYPQLYWFGENQFEIEFEGEQTVHVMSLRASVGSGMATESTNTSWTREGSQELYAKRANRPTGESMTYVTTVNIHDENLNVIARANLAQPVPKRSQDKMTFVVKIDW